MVSWVSLQSLCPVDLRGIVNKAQYIDNRLVASPDLSNLDKYKDNLLKARSELDIIIGQLISLLNDTDLFKTSLELGMYRLLKDDLAGYLAIMDEKQERLIEVHDGENLGIGRTMAYRGVLFVALRGILYDSLYSASTEYWKLPEKIEIKTDKDTKEIKKDTNLFLRILFLTLSSKLTVLGGIQRRRQTGGKVIVDYSSQNLPRTFTTKGQETIGQEYKDRFGEELDLSGESSLFEEDSNEP